MLKFINVKTGDNMNHISFVTMVWRMSEERYEKLTGKLWCNLTAYEQNICYCIQYEDLVKEGWMMFPEKWRFSNEN